MKRLVAVHDQIIDFLRTDRDEQLAMIMPHLTSYIFERDFSVHEPEAERAVQSSLRMIFHVSVQTSNITHSV